MTNNQTHTPRGKNITQHCPCVVIKHMMSKTTPTWNILQAAPIYIDTHLPSMFAK